MQQNKDIGEYRRLAASQLLRDLGFVLDPKAIEMIPTDATIQSLHVSSMAMRSPDNTGTVATIEFTRPTADGFSRFRLDLTMDPEEEGTQYKLRSDD